MSSLRDLQPVIIRDPRTCIRGYHMPLLQNSKAQHQSAQASGSWSLQKKTLARDSSLHFQRVLYCKSLAALLSTLARPSARRRARVLILRTLALWSIRHPRLQRQPKPALDHIARLSPFVGDAFGCHVERNPATYMSRRRDAKPPRDIRSNPTPPSATTQKDHFAIGRTNCRDQLR